MVYGGLNDIEFPGRIFNTLNMEISDRFRDVGLGPPG